MGRHFLKICGPCEHQICGEVCRNRHDTCSAKWLCSIFLDFTTNSSRRDCMLALALGPRRPTPNLPETYSGFLRLSLTFIIPTVSMITFKFNQFNVVCNSFFSLQMQRQRVDIRIVCQFLITTNSDSNRNTKNIKIAIKNSNLCGKDM